MMGFAKSSTHPTCCQHHQS